jgi:rhodanese-related sulfurtransferase
MKANELFKRIESKSAPVIIDARSPMGFRRGHIPGALNAPVLKILFKTAHLPKDKNIEMVIACMHGQRRRSGGGQQYPDERP